MATDRETGILSGMSINGPLGATPQTGSFELRAPAHARQAAARTRLGRFALAGVLLSGLVLCVSAAHTNTLLPETVRPVPASLAGPFANLGLHLGVGVLAALMSLMFVAYVVAVREAERLSPRMVLMAVGALNALVLLAPPLLSTDIFSYQAYAREWITYSSNPYLSGPHIMMLDPLYPYVGAKWIGTPTVYGPLFTAMSAFLGPVSVAVSALTYKALAGLASLATIALLWHGARLRGLNPARAVALFGLNPLVTVYGVGGGHNDLLMLVLTTAGVCALLSHRERTSGAMITAGAAIKLTGGLILPFALVAGVELGSAKRRRAVLVGAALTALAIAAVSFSLFGLGILNLVPTLHQVQAEGDWHSIPGFITSALGLGGLGEVAGIALGVVFVAVFGWLLRRVWRRQMDWIDGAAWATLAMLLTASSVLPWYVAWLLPLVALCTDRRLWRWSLVLSGVMLATTMLGYIPHGSTFLGIPVVP